VDRFTGQLNQTNTWLVDLSRRRIFLLYAAVGLGGGSCVGGINWNGMPAEATSDSEIE